MRSRQPTLSEHIRTQLTKKLDQLKAREDGLFALIGDPQWDRGKLNTHMRTVRKEKDETQRQLATLRTVLDTGRQIFLTAIDMLANPRRVYNSGPDEIKTLLTKTIFTKLYFDADEHGTITVTTTATEHDSHTNTPDHTHPRDTTDLATRLALAVRHHR